MASTAAARTRYGGLIVAAMADYDRGDPWRRRLPVCVVVLVDGGGGGDERGSERWWWWKLDR